MRISDWSSDVCSSDLIGLLRPGVVDEHDDIAALREQLNRIIPLVSLVEEAVIGVAAMRHDDRGVALSLTIGARKNDIACRLVTMPVDPSARMPGYRSDIRVPRRNPCAGCVHSIVEMDPHEHWLQRPDSLDGKIYSGTDWTRGCKTEVEQWYLRYI